MSKFTAEEIYNSITDLYDVKGSFERWSEYRNRITDFMISKMEKNCSIAILGVGESNDLDLRKLYDFSGKLTLVDKNVESIEKAVGKYGICGGDKLNIVQADFLGITKADYIDVIRICRNDIVKMKNLFSPYITGPKFRRKLEEIITRVNSKDVDLGIDNHDYVICVGVHSQLFAQLQQIWKIMMEVARRNGADYPGVYKRISEQNDYFMPRFNEAILDKTNKSAFIGVEVRENEAQMIPEGALQAYQDIIEKVEKRDLVTWMDVWPYRDELTYQMAIFFINKNQYLMSTVN